MAGRRPRHGEDIAGRRPRHAGRSAGVSVTDLSRRLSSGGVAGDPAFAPTPGRRRARRSSGTVRRAATVLAAVVVVVATAAAGTVTALTKTVTVRVEGSSRQVTTMAGDVAGALASAGIRLAQHDAVAPAARAPIADGSVIVLDRGRRMTLVVDGNARTLWTTGRTVAAALALAGVQVGRHDTLAPAAQAPLTDGQRIVLDRARPLTLTIDGTEHRVWTTATTVREAMARLGRRADEYRLSADRSRPIPLTGLSVTATTLHTVTLTNGVGRPATVTTTAGTVADLLAERQITLGARDLVSPPAGTDLADGMTVRIVRRAVTTIAHTETVPQPADREILDNLLEQGTRSVVLQGHPGVALVSQTVTLTNGSVTAVGKTTRSVVTPAVAGVVHVGTAPQLEWVGNQVYTHDHTYGVNWDGLAMCESTHNPRAINANPSAGLPTYGLFQFDLPTWRSVGGTGNPIDASPAEQLLRAKMLYQKRGLSPWACAYAAH
jgi:uncharacterized protein YabE (DUF348 family)